MLCLGMNLVSPSVSKHEYKLFKEFHCPLTCIEKYWLEDLFVVTSGVIC